MDYLTQSFYRFLDGHTWLWIWMDSVTCRISYGRRVNNINIIYLFWNCTIVNLSRPLVLYIMYRPTCPRSKNKCYMYIFFLPLLFPIFLFGFKCNTFSKVVLVVSSGPGHVSCLLKVEIMFGTVDTFPPFLWLPFFLYFFLLLWLVYNHIVM